LCQSIVEAIQATNISAVTIKLWENEIAWTSYRLSLSS
jgi:hypothetical protein